MNRKGGSLDMDKQFQRIDAIVGDNAERDFAEALSIFYTHLRQHLVLPCDVTGTEDFRWEERYMLGPGDPKEYARLKKSQPSYRDHYELLKIEQDVVSEWMLFAGDDIAAHVRRKSDGKEFVLGLAELRSVDKSSSNHRHLNDYAVFLVNYR
jgi:hypothetical protein